MSSCKVSVHSNPSQYLSIAFSSWPRLIEVMVKEGLLHVKSWGSAADLERVIWEEESFWWCPEKKVIWTLFCSSTSRDRVQVELVSFPSQCNYSLYEEKFFSFLEKHCSEWKRHGSRSQDTRSKSWSLSGPQFPHQPKWALAQLLCKVYEFGILCLRHIHDFPWPPFPAAF